MGKHATLAASASERWIPCPGSIARSRGCGKSSSWFAMEGTAAHALADTCLSQGLDAEQFTGDRIYVHDEKETARIPARIEEGGKKEERLVEGGYVRFEVDDEMAEGVQLYLDAVRSKDPLGDQVRTEMYLDMSWLHKELGGTADAHVLGDDGWIDLFDLKYGAGVVVEVNGNTQQKIYALGILHKHEDVAKGVRMHIVQPRAFHVDGPVRMAEYTREELWEFGAELVAAANRTGEPDAELKAGGHCRFCPGKVGCPALEEKINEVARADFADEPPTMDRDGKLEVPKTADALSRAMSWIPVIDAWVKDVEGAVQRELEHGRVVPDWKLVRKKSNRRFVMEDGEVVRHMIAVDAAKEEDCYAPRKIKSPAQMEKISKAAKATVADIVEKPEGGLTVAHWSDARPEVDMTRAAQVEFNDDDPLA